MRLTRRLAFAACALSSIAIGGTNFAQAAPEAGFAQAAPSVLATEASPGAARFVEKAWSHHCQHCGWGWNHWGSHHWHHW
jgi:hypothetical protein